MAVSTFPSVATVTTTATTLSSSGNILRSSSVQLAVVSLAPSSAQRTFSVRASLSEEQSVTRRDVLVSLLGAGSALGFSGQAFAANPGSLARQRKVEKPESKVKRKEEEVKPSVTIESGNQTPSASPIVASSPEEPKLADVSTPAEPLDTPNLSSISEVPSVEEPPSAPEIPNPHPAEAPAPEAKAPNYDDYSLGDYFKDLF